MILVLMKRVIHKICRIYSNFFRTVGMLVSSTALPERSDAKVNLEEISPDLDNSCWIDREDDYEKRNFPLSVIVPAYNVEKYIVDCLESILRQKVSFDYEIIVINDGSTDATPDLLEKYRHREKIRIIHQENGGLSAARNTGIACAKGEYFCFVDSDDKLSEGALECLMTIALQKGAALVIGSYEKCLRDGTVRHIKQLNDQKIGDTSLPGFAWGRVIHCSVFRNLRFPERYWFEDSIMAQIVHPMCKDTAYTTAHVCYQYYSNEAGITSTAAGKPKAIDSLWITMKLLEERKKFRLSYDQASYEYFLSMVNLTYQRTKQCDVSVAKCIFVLQKMLMETYYNDYRTTGDKKKKQIEDALRTNSFRKYILACERKR